MSQMVQDIHFCRIDKSDTVFDKLYDMIAVVPAQLLLQNCFSNERHTCS